jgi:hypothetical protein
MKFFWFIYLIIVLFLSIESRIPIWTSARCKTDYTRLNYLLSNKELYQKIYTNNSWWFMVKEDWWEVWACKILIHDVYNLRLSNHGAHNLANRSRNQRIYTIRIKINEERLKQIYFY